MKRYLLITLIALLFTTCESPKGKNKSREVKNIILLIGDGMGLTQIYAAMSVSSDPLNFEQFKNIGFHKTYSSSNYVTDSGAGATAISTGSKTHNNRIAVDTSGIPLKTILELAEENNLSTGLIATSSILHATPASFIAHVDSRKKYEEIAKYFLSTDIDLFIGGGRENFVKRTDGLDLIDSLKTKNYFVADSVHHIPQGYCGKLAVLSADLHNPRFSENRGDLLPDATEKALEILSKNDKGFFIMIEGSQIDWGGEDNDIDYVTSEVLDFNKAIGKALEFAKKDGQTLVIVTADHETGGLALTGGNIKERTIESSFAVTKHTGVMVPVFAFGPGAENFTGIYENTEIFEKMVRVFGFEK